MFGRSAAHYADHFGILLDGIGYKDYSDFKEKFPGNISDFSLGEKSGWEQAIRSVFGISNEEELALEQTYKCCGVHFRRSVQRVKSSHRLVPRHKLDDFEHKINTLLSKNIGEDRFYETVDAIRNEFPHLKDWIDWYVTNNIEKCFFPSVANGSIKGFGNDTNAQDSRGFGLCRCALPTFVTE